MREARCVGRCRRRFRVDTIMALADDLHCVLTLPRRNADLSNRAEAIQITSLSTFPCPPGLDARSDAGRFVNSPLLRHRALASPLRFRVNATD
jgi:REP element-mobilizing transposase RayT